MVLREASDFFYAPDSFFFYFNRLKRSIYPSTNMFITKKTYGIALNQP